MVESYDKIYEVIKKYNPLLVQVLDRIDMKTCLVLCKETAHGKMKAKIRRAIYTFGESKGKYKMDPYYNQRTRVMITKSTFLKKNYFEGYKIDKTQVYRFDASWKEIKSLGLWHSPYLWKIEDENMTND